MSESDRPKLSIRLTYFTPSGLVYGKTIIEAPVWWVEVGRQTGAQILERLVETLGTAPGLLGDASRYMTLIEDMYYDSQWFVHARDDEARDEAYKAGKKLWGDCSWKA